MYSRFRLFPLLLCVPVCLAGTPIADIVRNADGTLASGRAVIAPNAPFPSGGDYIGPSRVTVAFTDGKFTVDLAPTPAGSSYLVRWLLKDGSTFNQYWVVPESAQPLTVKDVAVPSPPSPDFKLDAAQIASGGAKSGDLLRFDGSAWKPGALTAESLGAGRLSANNQWTGVNRFAGTLKADRFEGALRDFVNLRDFGADCSSATTADDNAAWSAWLASSRTAVRIPDNCYSRVTQPILISSPGRTIVGEGMNSIVECAGFSCIKITASGVEIRRLSVRHSPVPAHPNTVGVEVDGEGRTVAQILLDGLYISGLFPGNDGVDDGSGVKLRDVVDIKITGNTRIVFWGKAGLYAPSQVYPPDSPINALYISDSSIVANNWNIICDGCGDFTIAHSNIENCGSGGLLLRAGQATLIGNHFENNPFGSGAGEPRDIVIGDPAQPALNPQVVSYGNWIGATGVEIKGGGSHFLSYGDDLCCFRNTSTSAVQRVAIVHPKIHGPADMGSTSPYLVHNHLGIYMAGPPTNNYWNVGSTNMMGVRMGAPLLGASTGTWANQVAFSQPLTATGTYLDSVKPWRLQSGASTGYLVGQAAGDWFGLSSPFVIQPEPGKNKDLVLTAQTNQTTGLRVAAADNRVYAGAGLTVTGTLNASPGGAVPACGKYTVSGSALTAASTTQDVTLFALPARAKITGVTERTVTAFSGSGLTSLTLSLGDSAGGASIYTPSGYNLITAPGNSNFRDTAVFRGGSLAGSNVTARFTANRNLNQAAISGSVEINVCWVTLP